MNQDDDSFDELREPMRREALFERPRFSELLHQRVIQDIRFRRPGVFARNFRKLAIAAAILLVAGLIAPWLIRPHSQQARDISPNNVSTGVQIPKNESISLRFGNVVAARFSAAGIAVDLPMVEQDQPKPAAPAHAAPPVPASPQWVLAQMNRPANDAAAALSDMIPSQIHALAKFVKPQDH